MAVVRPQRGRFGRHHHARAESSGLECRALGQLAARDPGREAEVIFDPGRGAGLPAERHRVDHLRVEPLRGAIDRRCQTGRPGPHDHHIAHRRRGTAGAQTEQRRYIGVGRVAGYAVAGDHHRRIGGRHPEGAEQRLGLLVLRDIHPLVGHAVARQELPHPP
jgi:hypothetical protein